MKIRVVLYRVGKPPAVEEIDNQLPALQALVGGYIEVVWLRPGLALVCNEEGKLLGLRRNRYVPQIADYIAGDFFFAATKDAEFVSLKDEEVAEVCNEVLWRHLRVLRRQ